MASVLEPLFTYIDKHQDLYVEVSAVPSSAKPGYEAFPLDDSELTCTHPVAKLIL